MKIGFKVFSNMVLSVLAGIVIMVITCEGSAFAADNLTAGAARAEITPSEEDFESGHVYLGGYGGPWSRRADGAWDDIYARALAISDGNETFVVLSLGVTGISNVQIKQIEKKISSAAGVPTGNIVITVTHTHGGPDLQGIFGGSHEEYRAYVRKQAAKAAAEAVASAEPAVITMARKTARGLVRNRRGGEHLDENLYVLQAGNRQSGEVIATSVIFGAHSNITDGSCTKISPCFTGGLAARLEEVYGGVSIFLPGVMGDQNPITEDIDCGHRRAIAYGERIAEETVAALSKDNEYQDTYKELAVRPSSALIPLNVQNRRYTAAWMLGILDYDLEVEFRAGAPSNYVPDVKLSYIRLGDEILIRTMPGETLSGAGVEMQRQAEPLEYRYTPVLSLANDNLGYLVSQGEWNEDGYEESMSVGKDAVPKILKTYQKIVDSERN